MQVFVKTHLGKHIIVEVNPTDRIEEVKKNIEDKEGFPADQHHLIFAGQYLEDGNTLQDYCVEKDSILQMVVGLPGGGRNGPHNYNPSDQALAERTNCKHQICRKCGARLSAHATQCRHKRCGHSAEVRPKKPFYR
jgi:ribosomal protein L40E